MRFATTYPAFRTMSADSDSSRPRRRRKPVRRRRRRARRGSDT
jgi:hypothetical protein